VRITKSVRITAYIVGWLPPLILACFSTASSANARDVYYGKSKETVVVPFGVETLFRFPMEVKTITEANRFEILPANTEEPDYSVLKVKPRMSEGSADVTFLLSDGSIARTQLVISNKPNLKRDSIYDFKPSDDLLNSNPSLAEPVSGVKHDAMAISELDLLRAMIRGENVSGFDVSHYSLNIPIGSPYLTAQLTKVYRGRDLNGYVYKLQVDGSGHSYEVDLKALAIGHPNLAVLSQIDRKVIGGSKSEERESFLRIIAKPGSSASKVILPVEIKSNSRSEAR
jgi:hypothetical protein